MLGNIEAYLACCQLGITMASLGLGWVGEPTVAALLHPVLTPLGMRGSGAASRLVPDRLFAVLVAAHRHRRAGAENPGDPPSPSRSRSGSPIRCTPRSCCFIRSTGCSIRPRVRCLRLFRVRRRRSQGNPQRSRTRRISSKPRRSTAAFRKVRPSTSRTSSASASSKCRT